jgi:hypothetical protein
MRKFIFFALSMGCAHVTAFGQVALQELPDDLQARHVVKAAATTSGTTDHALSFIPERPTQASDVHIYTLEKTNDPRVGLPTILHADIKRFLVAQNQSQTRLALDLSNLFLGQKRQAIETAMGPVKGVKDVPVRGEEDPRTGVYSWLNLSEYYYRKAGYVIRVIYGRNDEAISLFVGMSGKTQAPISSFGDWPVDKLPLPIHWEDVKFKHVGWKDCDQWVNTAASASLVSITCPYSRTPLGSSTASRSSCYFSAGYSDGAFGVDIVADHPELSSFEVDKWREKNFSDKKIQELTWQSIKDRSLNYFMLTCDERLIKQDFDPRDADDR